MSNTYAFFLLLEFFCYIVLLNVSTLICTFLLVGQNDKLEYFFIYIFTFICHKQGYTYLEILI